MPPYIPWPRAVALLSGIFEIAAALALLSPRLRRPAGLALMLFIVAVTPVHIEMLREPERYAFVGTPLLWARLLFQPVLVWIVWAATRPPAGTDADERAAIGC